MKNIFSKKGGILLVYCHNCGNKNEEDAEFCSKCGTPLKDEIDYQQRRKARKREREECFGLPHGGLVVAAIIGFILIIFGISNIFKLDIGPFIGPIVIILIGILIILGAIYRYRNQN